MHVLETAFCKLLRHTGARCLMRSSAVSNHSSIVRNLFEVLLDFIRRNAYSAWQFHSRFSPGFGIASVDKRKLFIAIHSFFNFIHRDSCYFHLAPPLVTPYQTKVFPLFLSLRRLPLSHL